MIHEGERGRNDRSVAEHRWLVDIDTSASGRDQVLYAFPHAGAGAAAVAAMCRAVAAGGATAAVRLPGRESRMDEPPIADLATVADEVARQIVAHARDRRIHLYGHCSGALLAYEVAARLPAARLAVLVVSAHPAPDRVPRTYAWQLPDDAFLDRVEQDGYLPVAVRSDPELIELVIAPLRADYEAIEMHRSALTVLAGTPILGLMGRDQQTVTEDEMRAWAGFAGGGFRLVRLPGGHNQLRDNAAAVADAVSKVFR